MDSFTKKITGAVFACLLGVNAWFVRGLATKVEETHISHITDHATIQQMNRDVSEVKEALRGFQDLRIDVAILKHDVNDLKGSVTPQKGKKYDN